MMPTIARFVLSRTAKRLAAGLMDWALRQETIDSLTVEQKRILARNAIFRDRHKGQRCFVIVNGPSLKGQDISPLGNEITFVVSGFWKHPVVEEWQPTYYCLLDKHFFSGDAPAENFVAELNKRIHDSTFFLPLFRGHDANKDYMRLNTERSFYVAAFGDPFPSVDITQVVQGSSGSSAFALLIAIYMGCSPIYLLGFDHDYLANRGVDRHFYEGATIEGSRLETIPLGERVPYDTEMEANLRLWKNYRNLKAIAEGKNIKIYNATDGGYLDVFDRIAFESISKR
jgi:hypothetical protein